MSDDYGVIVVGAGHAGIEAAAAAARMGVQVGVFTMSRAMVGEMPCNPAMGGVGKGHLMAELDALGGVQAWAADRAGIQFKVLNRSKGSAVWGPRAQCDRFRYRSLMRRLLEGMAGIDLVEEEVVALVERSGSIAGVVTATGRRVFAGAVVLTTGTFLQATLHTGMERMRGGRRGEAASIGLSESLRALGVGTRRYKTGTPPRIRRRSIDLSQLEVQEGDVAPRPFSWRTRAVTNRVCCWITRTPERVQQIIMENLDSSPLYSGEIEGTGPRYCPSIEDKVVRFPHHRQHTVFLEPEGLQSESIYLNGLSTSLAGPVQEKVVRAVPGLEKAEILRYGYAVEYDVVAPGSVTSSLEARALPGLYLGGQVLGTSGYEEAAALGLMAGINAVQKVRGQEAVVIGREQGYIGVLVDDLVKKQLTEPYRMMTSRAELRLLLGVDSARERLMAIGVAHGLVPERVFHVEQVRWQRRHQAVGQLEEQRLDAELRQQLEQRLGVKLAGATTWAAVLRRPDLDGGLNEGEAREKVLRQVEGLDALDEEDRQAVVSRLRYRGYLDRQQRELDRVRRLRGVAIPERMAGIEQLNLSREVREALTRFKPKTLAEVEQLPGLTPAAVAIIAGWLARGGHE